MAEDSFIPEYTYLRPTVLKYRGSLSAFSIGPNGNWVTSVDLSTSKVPEYPHTFIGGIEVSGYTNATPGSRQFQVQFGAVGGNIDQPTGWFFFNEALEHHAMGMIPIGGQFQESDWGKPLIVGARALTADLILNAGDFLAFWCMFIPGDGEPF